MYYGGYYGMYWDPTYILVIIGMVICLLASARVKIRHISGDLTDNYDPSNRVLNLSDATFRSSSVAAIGVAAHECGHAIQDAESYAPLKIRGAIVPVVNFGATISWPLILIGIVLGGSRTLIMLGVLLFSLTVIFQLVTLPVEFNASSRALKILGNSHILYDDEISGARKVLTAAALTYVAAAASSILQLLQIREMEGERILSKIKDDDYVIALCIDGKHYSTSAWKKRMERVFSTVSSDVVFVIGGSLGLADKVVRRANEKLSFSALTFPHQMMRLILCEQIARIV